MGLTGATASQEAGTVFFGLGIIAIFCGYRALRDQSKAPFHSERDDLRRKIAEHRKIADGID